MFNDSEAAKRGTSVAISLRDLASCDAQLADAARDPNRERKVSDHGLLD
jgi:hypothetical protein